MGFLSHKPSLQSKAKVTSPKLHQLQYRSYIQDIKIYHFSHTSLHLHRFIEHCKNANNGFVGQCLSRPMPAQDIPDGDELPNNKTEAIYIPGAYMVTTNGTMSNVRGSALGFIATEKVVWCSFAKPVDAHLEALAINTNGKLVQAGDNDTRNNETVLFELVGFIEKNSDGSTQRRITGRNSNHREWFELLGEATGNPLPKDLANRERLVKVCRQWEMFREAGYDVAKSGYTPQAVEKLVNLGVLAEEDKENEG